MRTYDLSTIEEGDLYITPQNQINLYKRDISGNLNMNPINPGNYIEMKRIYTNANDTVVRYTIEGIFLGTSIPTMVSTKKYAIYLTNIYYTKHDKQYIEKHDYVFFFNFYDQSITIENVYPEFYSCSFQKKIFYSSSEYTDSDLEDKKKIDHKESCELAKKFIIDHNVKLKITKPNINLIKTCESSAVSYQENNGGRRTNRKYKRNYRSRRRMR